MLRRQLAALACGTAIWLALPPPALGQGTAAAPTPPASRAATGTGAQDASRPPLERRVSLDVHNVPLDTVLASIAAQAQVTFVYTNQVVPVGRRVTVRLTNVSVRRALDMVLEGMSIEVREMGEQVVLSRGGKGKRGRRSAVVDSGWVCGRVRDSATGKPLPGALVSVNGTMLRSVATGDSAIYFLKVPVGVHTITVRMLGYMKAAREVAVMGRAVRVDQAVRVDFGLEMGLSRLQEMVTTATGPRRRMDIANDVTVLNVDSIVATQPVSSVTDLLEGRVPGLVVMHTSGAPGDPSRLRLRGASSVLRSNDPIVIVDGIRVYAAQSDARSANLAGGNTGISYAVPSPLDQLDPHSIETIEVLKGPSAATLYGPDAANGVIVITTKKGRPGPARWSVSAVHGLSYMPGRYPMGLYRWGHDFYGRAQLCTLTQFNCVVDSVTHFQALNDPTYTVLGQGSNGSVSLGVSGGTTALTYALSGSYAEETGLLTLPDIEASRFEARHGAAPPTWMRRPQQLTRWGGASRLTARLGDRADASLSTALTRMTQQRSDLERQLGGLMATYPDPATDTYRRPSGNGVVGVYAELVPDFYERATDVATNFTNAAALTWRPRSWLTTSATAGLNVINRQDAVLLNRGLHIDRDSLGRLSAAHGSSVVSTVNLRATATAPLFWGFHLQFGVGANYSKTSIADLRTAVRGLVEGTSSLNGAGEITASSENASDVTSFGWYLEPSFTHRRFSISTGLRLDGSSSFGTHVKLPAFPKLGVSWLISDESWFPLKSIFDALRLRAAYGQAGVWPGPADRLRLYKTSLPWLDGGFVDVTNVSTLGNTQLEPERSTEWEGGFDADLFDNRLGIGLTGYRKMRYDALMHVPVPPSVYGSNVTVLRNIGVIRNTGIELSLTTQLVRTDPVTWSATLNLSRNHNLVVELGRGVVPFKKNTGWVVAGYPLFGRWDKPIVGYADANGNGVIEASEVQLGDSSVFLGGSEPNYEANLATTLSFFRGALTASASLAYQDGLTQLNQTVLNNWAFSRAQNDPAAPFSEQAAVAVVHETNYGIAQTVSTLRFTSLSVAFNAPPSLARRLGARALSLALQGTNLGLKTNYRGKDPNVNAYATGNAVADTGVLPIPRSWQLAVRVTY